MDGRSIAATFSPHNFYCSLLSYRHQLGPIASKNIQETDWAAHTAFLGAAEQPQLGPIVSKNILQVDRAAHTATLGADGTGSTGQCVYNVQYEPVSVRRQAISKVEPVLKNIADLKKVCMRSKNCTQEKSPSLVCGMIERFHNIETVIPEWEEIEGDEREWEEVGGIRRGGRRVSKRMSELLDRFEKGRGEEENETQAGSSAVVKDYSTYNIRENYLSNVSNSYSSPSLRKSKHKIIDNGVSTNVIQVGNETKSEACDWSTECIPSKFVANRKPEFRKRPREQESEIPNSRTKRIRP